MLGHFPSQIGLHTTGHKCSYVEHVCLADVLKIMFVSNVIIAAQVDNMAAVMLSAAQTLSWLANLQALHHQEHQAHCTEASSLLREILASLIPRETLPHAFCSCH